MGLLPTLESCYAKNVAVDSRTWHTAEKEPSLCSSRSSSNASSPVKSSPVKFSPEKSSPEKSSPDKTKQPATADSSVAPAVRSLIGLSFLTASTSAFSSAGDKKKQKKG